MTLTLEKVDKKFLEFRPSNFGSSGGVSKQNEKYGLVRNPLRFGRIKTKWV